MSYTIQNTVSNNDVFEDADEGYTSKVTISVQQRTSRKSTTLIEGLDQEFNFKKILKYMRKNFRCNGTVVHHKETNDELILLQGNHMENAASFMIQMNICNENQIIRKGL